VRRLTLREVNEEHGGRLPPDATLRADDEPARPAAANPAPAAKPKRRSGRGERFAALNAFTDCALADLTGAEAKCWLIVFRDVKAATGTARTGQADIARRAGLEPRTVRRALASLEAKGMVRVVRRGRLNGGPSTYRVHPTGTA
jgi:DNA-binding transcriptional ArsR family regulator